MFTVIMPSSASLSEETSVSSGSTRRVHDFASLNPMVSTINSQYQHQNQQKIKKKRNLPGNPDPDAEVIALSPKTLLATNRFVCEVCNKGFQRDQNLQLHRRGHNLPWKLKQKSGKEVRKKAYVCPETSCVHHHPSRALGDLTGIKKHFCRKHGEKKWKCEKCSKIYAVQSDWKAHSKTCGTREYRCDCGTLFSRKDSFITHRAFCDALAEESARLSANQLGTLITNTPPPPPPHLFQFSTPNHHHHHFQNPPWDPPQNPSPNLNQHTQLHIKPETMHHHPPPSQQQPISSKQFFPQPPSHTNLATSPFRSLHVSTTHHPTSSNAASPHLSATALLQKAASMGAHSADEAGSTMSQFDITATLSPEFMGFAPRSLATWKKTDRLTRDFLGLTGDGGGRNVHDGGVDVNVSVRNMLTFTGSAGYERDHSLLKAQGCFGFTEPPASETWGNC